jgi:hypothetical protein
MSLCHANNTFTIMGSEHYICDAIFLTKIFFIISNANYTNWAQIPKINITW